MAIDVRFSIAPWRDPVSQKHGFRIPQRGPLFPLETGAIASAARPLGLRQGKDGPGGAKSYTVNGKMTDDFAFLAYPAEYRSSGVMTFIVGQDGVVYQKDLGKKTQALAKAVKEYDPDTAWQKLEEQDRTMIDFEDNFGITEEHYLSFAKIASGNMSLGCNAFITTMQTAELRNLMYPSDPRDLPRKWPLFVEPQMRPRPVVVSEIRNQGSPQMPGVEDHEMVQAVSAYGAD
jgi:Protein of unknown function (DUF2950)